MSTRYLSVKEVAERWRVSQMTVRRLIEDGQLAHTRVGHSVRIEESEAERYIEHNTWDALRPREAATP